ncbi:MAG: nucleotide sugar dehydrogenase [Candidatus Sumerlaeota bacterium]
MDRKLAVVGLGYVGLPLAVAFGKTTHVLGFDVKTRRIEELRKGVDRTNEVEEADLETADIDYTDDPSRLKEADFIIVAVPTPIDEAHRPDLRPLVAASNAVGQNLAEGAIVVFESTVYPGVTEEVCVPILEAESGKSQGMDFHVGYSPERINPGDKVHTLSNVVKVVSAESDEILDIVAEVYERVVEAGVHRAPSIKTAEAAKVIENTQRDLNIALVNELAMIFDRLGVDTLDVLTAAGTKWNFLNFRPGLVGGHCIGVDPYYLTHKAEQTGYHPQVILAGRRINDNMGRFVAQKAIKLLIGADVNPKGARVAVLGLTFKEDVPDLRNSRVCSIIEELDSFGVEVLVHDPMASPEELQEEYGLEMASEGDLQDLDGVIMAVAHKPYRDRGAAWLADLTHENGIVLDVKSVFRAEDFPDRVFWRL